MMKKEYLIPRLSVISVENSDIVTISGAQNGTSMSFIDIDELMNTENT